MKQKTTIRYLVVAILIGVAIYAFNGTIDDSKTEYADIVYRLSATDSFSSENVLAVQLETKNVGTMDIVPKYNVSVINATIDSVSMPNLQQDSLSDSCETSENQAIISNQLIRADTNFFILATINVIPNEGVSSFGVFSDVIMPVDLIHQKNRALRSPPYEYFYGLDNQGNYKLID